MLPTKYRDKIRNWFFAEFCSMTLFVEIYKEAYKVMGTTKIFDSRKHST